MPEDEAGKVVDFGDARVRHRARDLEVVCPRCGHANFMRDTRCQHCGLWFDGEAFQFAPSDVDLAQRRRRLARLVVIAAGSLVAVLIVAAIIGMTR